MLVYRDLARTVDPRAVLARIIRSVALQFTYEVPDRDASVDTLIEFGEIETALTDHLFPDKDGFNPEIKELRQLAYGLGLLFLSAWHQRKPDPGLASLIQKLDRMRKRLHAGKLRIRVPEGFAIYGVHPASYLLAAEEFARQFPFTHVECIGLRSIGTPLSAIVAAVVGARGCMARCYTVRPRGEPFSRRPVIDASLSDIWLSSNEQQAHFLLVDEGPGLSGSSLCGTADYLLTLGIPEAHIHFFPSWNPDPARFLSKSARECWPRHRRFFSPFDLQEAICLTLDDKTCEEISAGAWRSLVYANESEYPAVQPQHERRKYLSRPLGSVIKFAGFGHYGREKMARAHKLSSWTPPVVAYRGGFIMQKFVPGKPLRRNDINIDLIDVAAQYFVYLQQHFSADEVDPEPLAMMARANINEALGGESLAFERYLAAFNDLLVDAPAVALDGRVQPHEWIQTERTILKVDALDHHADHFYPGTADIAWDLSAFACEFDLGDDGMTQLIHRFIRHGGDGQIAARLPFYRIAYAAFRLGYSRLAEETLGESPDALRFASLSAHYRTQLRSSLARIGA